MKNAYKIYAFTAKLTCESSDTIYQERENFP